MHYNLLFNGCSFTLGSELEGKENDLEFRRLNRFSHIISKKTNKTYVNISKGGCSNDYITRTTIEWFETGNTCDLAIIQLTQIKRTEYPSKYFNDLSLFSLVNFFPHSKCRETSEDYDQIKNAFEHYYKYVYNNTLGLYDFYKNIFILEQYFEKNNIKYFFTFIGYKSSEINYNPNIEIPWKSLCKTKYETIPHIDGGILNIKRKENFCIKYPSIAALNGLHPSKLGHQKIAHYIINHAL